MHSTSGSSDALPYASPPPKSRSRSSTPHRGNEQEECLALESTTGSSRTDHAQQDHDLAFSIVWSPLPPITWLIPFIGHTGICDSDGIASDFQGPYSVGDDGRMAFGAPTRALKVDIAAAGVTPEQWDQAVSEANDNYRGRMHNICFDNCHSHVAFALNSMSISAYGIKQWNMVKIAILVFFRGRFLSWSAVLQQFLPFCVIIALILWWKV